MHPSSQKASPNQDPSGPLGYLPVASLKTPITEGPDPCSHTAQLGHCADGTRDIGPPFAFECSSNGGQQVLKHESEDEAHGELDEEVEETKNRFMTELSRYFRD